VGVNFSGRAISIGGTSVVRRHGARGILSIFEGIRPVCT
jgi:hypothetical protein